MSIHEEIREQQKKLKGQGFKAHLEYFWEYYKIHTLIAVFVIVLLSFLIHDIRTNKPYGFYAVLLNSSAGSAQDILEPGFTPVSGVDTTKNSVVIDTSASLDLTVLNETTIATSQKIMANIAGGDLDILGADENMFNYYANQQVYADLRSVLSAEELSKYEDRLIYVDQAYLDYIDSEEYQTYISLGEFDENNKYAVMADKYNKEMVFPTIDKNDMENPVPVGVRVNDSKVLAESGAYQYVTPVVGVVVNSKRPEIAAKFIEYLLQ